MRTPTTLAATTVFEAGILLGGSVSPGAGRQQQSPTGTTFTPAQLAERALHRQAVEAVIWGMPAVNYQLMYQEMVNKVGSGHNQFLSYEKA
jgi:hypothetical protein